MGFLWRTRQELPHVTAVVIEGWTEREDGLVAIDATVFVERDTQKQIVIGKGGGLLKEVGTEARAELAGLVLQPDLPQQLVLSVHAEPDLRRFGWLGDVIGQRIPHRD